MVDEPQGRKSKALHNPFNGRWMWWYSSIADWLIANPDGNLQDCAKKLGKHHNTISYIMQSDLFREYLAQRKREWRDRHDFSIVSKLTSVAERSLDLLLDKMDAQGDKMPAKIVAELATSSLDRLGYGPKQEPQVSVNIQTDNRVVMAPISAEALEEARDALRMAEQKKIIEHRANELPPPQRGLGGDELPRPGEVRGRDDQDKEAVEAPQLRLDDSVER